MEMPEGWRNLAENRGSTLLALILMKEMAEALEKYERQSDDGRPGYIPPQCEALKKFKEWK